MASLNMRARVQSPCAARAAGRLVPARAITARPCAVPIPASAACHADAEGFSGVTKRSLLLGAASVALLGRQLALPGTARADEVGYSTLLGLASPPTSYGGYGGNAQETPKYSFEYPSNWKSEVPSKVEKGTQGVDSRVVNPRSKDLRAFVITLGRAGEDNKSFRLTDVESTFAGFAGADYNLQDAVTSATSTAKSQREEDGNTFYEYDIDSPEYHYLSSIAVKNGKVFALFVRSPTKMFRANEDKLRHIQATFKLL